MLNGGGINPDGLSLDLQFAADKTLTARRGPTPDFTRGSTATFVGSDGLIQSAAINIPRFDHDPTSPFACRGLLIEESRTNLTVRSDDFGAGEWNQAAQRNLTVTANNTASPSGATDADLLTVGATTTTYQVVQALPATGNITSGTAYTVSCFFKAKEVTRVNIHAGNQVTFPADAIFDLTGVGSIIGTPTGTASIQQYPNGWYRCIITATAGATSNTSFRISPVSGTSRTYVGNSVDSFWAWGAQLEAGSFPTSYIPTTTGTLARGADVCNITGGDFNTLFNNVEGSVLFIGASAGTAASGTFGTAAFYLDISSSTTDRISFFSSLGSRVEIKRNNIDQYASNRPFFINTQLKQSIGYSSSQLSSGFNNNISMTSTANIALTMPSVNSFQIGRAGTASNHLNGTISAIRYYRKRLPNAKLQALTA